MSWSPLKKAIEQGFIDGRDAHRTRLSPLLIDDQASRTMSRAIISELRQAESFVFSVAFITPSALNVLKQDLLDFAGSGTIITSNYLGFNSPAAYRELLNIPNLDVRVVDARHGFHAKGYVFKSQGQTTAIVGSSNLTISALSSNHEWNFCFTAADQGHVVKQIEDAIDHQLSIATPLDRAWITEFECNYQPRIPPYLLDQRARYLPATEGAAWGPNVEAERSFARQASVTPNEMQKSALASLASLRAESKKSALVISATGTGKTILAALDVRAVAPERLLFLAHREQILDKAAQEFKLVLEAPKHEFGKLSGSSRDLSAKYLFATTQSFVLALRRGDVTPQDFDYVIVDEVHKAGARTYIEIVNFLEPKFMLGMTATPERNDGFNVFELFDYNLAYEIRLQDALDENMLAPFHYFGVTDFITADGQTVNEQSELRYLASGERVSHLIKKLEQYGQAGVPPRGLIFCSRNEEARELSRLLNDRYLNCKPLRTRALSGEDSIAVREQAVSELECGRLDYLLSVDVFNEGTDIPSLNQIVMMRQTQSSIVFTQQLGRGLRKAIGKDYLVVIDFIGNYANNYLIPTALFGDTSSDKDQLRRRLIGSEGDHIIAGISSINFDKIAKERVFAALSQARLDSVADIRRAYELLRGRLGRRPMLLDFARHETMDPVVVGTKYGNYAEIIRRFEPFDESASAVTESANRILTMLTTELLNGKRPHELLLLRELMAGRRPVTREAYVQQLTDLELDASDRVVRSVERVLSLEWFTDSERKKYGPGPLVSFDGRCFHLSARWHAASDTDGVFGEFARDVVEAGLVLSQTRYASAGELVVGERYTRKDVCRLLSWTRNEYSTIYGYKVDRESGTCPIFVTYHKADDIAASTRYEDRFIDQQTLFWYTRSKRTLASAEVAAIVSRAVPTYLFMKKDDEEGKAFIYLGEVTPSHAAQTTMPDKDGKPLSVVTMNLELPQAIDGATFDYLTRGGG